MARVSDKARDTMVLDKIGDGIEIKRAAIQIVQMLDIPKLGELGQRFVDLHDGSDPTQYHSPIKERGRTIDMILFAFHAFGNGALFHRDLARSDARYEWVADDTVEEAFAPLRIMDEYLRQTRALAPAGKTLWQPVAERLFG